MSSAKSDQLEAFDEWLIEQEAIARQNYKACALANDMARADMFASRARCYDIARDALQEFLIE
jgi:hypothetical protein